MARVVVYEHSMTILEGGTYDDVFRWLVGGAPVNLLNYTGIMQIRRKMADVTALLEIPFIPTPWVADGATGIYIMDEGIDGKYKVYINDRDTLNLCPDHRNSSGIHTLFLYNSFGESVLKQHGPVSFIASGAR